jgi:geranylgeranyl reductase family protein
MQQCDVLIVGGGPAGSSLAWSLRHAGLRVVIMDKSSFPRNKVCAGWITPAVVQSLSIDLDDYARGRILQPFHGFRIGQIGGDMVEARYGGEAFSYGIRRYEFDHYLLQRAGAELRLGEAFKEMNADGTGWIVNGTLRASLVIGGGGHFCPVARALGAKLGQAETVVAAQEIEFEMTPEQSAACTIQADIAELYFAEDLNGYAWAIRKQEYLNIGLGREDNHKIGEHVRKFCDMLKANKRIPRDIPSKFNGHAYLLYHRGKRPVMRDGVLLIGDAAGLAYPLSGEGIRPAVESAILAAKVILEAGGDYTQSRLSRYADRLRERFGDREAQGTGIAEHLPVGFKRLMAKKLFSSRWFARHVVMERWFLHSGLAPLLADEAVGERARR